MEVMAYDGIIDQPMSPGRDGGSSHRQSETERESMKIEYELREWYLYIRVTGDFDLQDGRDSVTLTYQRVLRGHVNNVLVDLTELQGENLRQGRYFYIQDMGTLHRAYLRARHPALNIAYVGSSRFVSDDGYEEQLAAPFALNIKTTPDMAEALEWLTAQPKVHR